MRALMQRARSLSDRGASVASTTSTINDGSGRNSILSFERQKGGRDRIGKLLPPSRRQFRRGKDRTRSGRSITQSSILIVVDEETRLPIGRPILTIAIDACANGREAST